MEADKISEVNQRSDLEADISTLYQRVRCGSDVEADIVSEGQMWVWCGSWYSIRGSDLEADKLPRVRCGSDLEADKLPRVRCGSDVEADKLSKGLIWKQMWVRCGSDLEADMGQMWVWFGSSWWCWEPRREVPQRSLAAIANEIGVLENAEKCRAF